MASDQLASSPASTGAINGVRHYRDLGVAALRANLSSVYQVWLWCHHLDKQANGGRRRGVVTVAALRDALTGDSPTRLFSWRRLRQILNEGEEAGFWQRDDRGRLWVAGEEKVKVALGVERLTGRAVYLPFEVLVSGRGEFNAHLGAAWHSGRTKGGPISQARKREITGIPERTQRRYNKRAGVKQQRNYAVGEGLTTESVQERAWKQGTTTFEFVDVLGKQGPAGCIYVGWRLPDTYTGPHCQAAKGRQKKINKATASLVSNTAPGNGPKQVDRLFYPDAATAMDALPKDTDAYWPAQKAGSGARVWGVMC